MAVAPPRLPTDDPRLRTRHLLALPDAVGTDEVEALARSRFTGARWETPVPTTTPRGRAARDPMAGVGVLRLSRHSSLVGPYALTADDAARLGVPAASRAAFVVVTPRERGEPPYPGGDRDGVNRAFPDGLPVREEERVLRWLVDVARRRGGAVRVADGAVLVPDPDAAVDLTVHTTRRLEPGTVLAVVRRVAPDARLALGATPWPGPAHLPAGVSSTPTATPTTTPTATPSAPTNPPTAAIAVPPAPGTRLGERVRRRLHDRADAVDAAALAAPPEPDGYGVEVDLGADGLVVVEAGWGDVVPLVLRGLPWTDAGTVTYRVHWEPADVEDLEREVATAGHRAARGRARPLVAAVARAVHDVVGGRILDAPEFPVEPTDL